MNKGNEKLMELIIALRKLPRWALILITLGVIICLGIAMFLLLPQQQEITPQGNSTLTTSTGLAFNVFLKLGVVVVIIIGFAIVIKKWQAGINTTKTNNIKIIETNHLTPHRSLYVVEFKNNIFLLGATDQTISVLSHTSTSEFSNNQENRDFADMLQNASSKQES